MAKIGRNDLCPCGSGKKYKHCCLGKEPRAGDVTGRSVGEAPPQFTPFGALDGERSDDEIARSLSATVGGDGDDTDWEEPGETPLDRAYDLAWKAREAQGAERVALAREALAESPDCPDAYAVLAEEAQTDEEAVAYFQEALAAVDRVIGPDWWNANPKRGWGEPYEVESSLRIRDDLAQLLMRMGRPEEAIYHLRRVIDYDPEDYDGFHYVLLSALLDADRDAEAMDLIVTYPETTSSRWPWAIALLKYRRDGDSLWARRALVDALAFNDDVAPYIIGTMPLPEVPRIGDLIGEDSDAVDAARHLGDAWRRTPGAVDWMRSIYDAGPKAKSDATPRGDGPVLCETPSDAVGYIRCPRCENKTKPRKRNVVVLIEPDTMVAERTPCRHCEVCNTLSILSRDLKRSTESAARRHNIGLSGRDHVPLGIVDPSFSDQRADHFDDRTWIEDHLHRWSDDVVPLRDLDRILGGGILDEEAAFDLPEPTNVIDVPFTMQSE